MVEVARVSYVFSVASVNFVLVNVIRVRVALLILPVQHFARDHGPSEQVASLVQRSEEAVLLAPDQVLGLVAHSDAVKQIKVRKRNHNDVVVALDEGDAVAKLTAVEHRALATHCACKLVLLDSALQ